MGTVLLKFVEKIAVLVDPFYICPPKFNFICHLEVLKTKMYYILVVNLLNSFIFLYIPGLKIHGHRRNCWEKFT